MNDKLLRLLYWARDYKMAPEEAERQRRSFALANGLLDGCDITKETIDKAAELIEEKDEKAN